MKNFNFDVNSMLNDYLKKCSNELDKLAKEIIESDEEYSINIISESIDHYLWEMEISSEFEDREYIANMFKYYTLGKVLSNTKTQIF